MRTSFCYPRVWQALAIAIAATLLTGCESPLNSTRAQRFGSSEPLQAPQVAPRALALGLVTTADGQSLSPQSLQAANALLTQQGRIGNQTLSITPFNAQGVPLAQRLAQALVRSGASAPIVLAVPKDATRLAQAEAAGWTLELQSEAVVVDTARCQIANSSNWTIHPYYGVGALGCANRANVASMASDPRDLNRPRTLEAADGRAAVLPIERYQRGEVRDLIDIDFEE
ncbi:CpaD family pilus assembly lipoprotein [Comamonas sp. Tr-654]|uniref:CpaD family pilus assembly lipoprotein n=1 Tax=Comamonas sp. Tr-654 TaxID=2608341 RepID=UPI0014218AD5|nr:CpaD family pilus assembly lipoprotein [Comamonas sp. Tr-654]